MSIAIFDSCSFGASTLRCISVTLMRIPALNLFEVVLWGKLLWWKMPDGGGLTVVTCMFFDSTIGWTNQKRAKLLVLQLQKLKNGWKHLIKQSNRQSWNLQEEDLPETN
uniref:Uncharacterized protein n=1 Tax=Opuntia streptacantha TaxID=393608 RepID=A0A7C9E508_OPUST